MSQKKIAKKLIATDVYGKTHPAYAEKFAFRPSVYGIIIKKSSILLVPCLDGYDFPGGGIDINETIDEALEREVWEETGLRVKKGSLVACEQSFFYINHSKKHFNSILMYFSCKNVTGKISDAYFMDHEKDTMRLAEWVPLHSVDKIKFINGIGTGRSRRIIKSLIK